MLVIYTYLCIKSRNCSRSAEGVILWVILTAPGAVPLQSLNTIRSTQASWHVFWFVLLPFIYDYSCITNVGWSCGLCEVNKDKYLLVQRVLWLLFLASLMFGDNNLWLGYWGGGLHCVTHFGQEMRTNKNHRFFTRDDLRLFNNEHVWWNTSLKSLFLKGVRKILYCLWTV